jgi:hypothetical protein
LHALLKMIDVKKIDQSQSVISSRSEFCDVIF